MNFSSMSIHNVMLSVSSLKVYIQTPYKFLARKTYMHTFLANPTVWQTFFIKNGSTQKSLELGSGKYPSISLDSKWKKQSVLSFFLDFDTIKAASMKFD